MRHAIVAGLTLLLFGAGIASAQTAATPATSSAPAAEPGRFTVSAEALLWWFKDSPAPVPLITDGLVGQPGTKTLLGGDDLDTGANPGFRLSSGYAFTDRWGVESSFFYIPSRSTSNSVSSGNQISRTINTSQDTAYTENPAAKLQGPAQPSFKFNSSDFWARGVNVGLAFRF